MWSCCFTDRAEASLTEISAEVSLTLGEEPGLLPDAFHSGVQAQTKRFFYFSVKERFSGISPSHFASYAPSYAYIILDILQGECKGWSVPSNILVSHFRVVSILTHS